MDDGDVASPAASSPDSKAVGSSTSPSPSSSPLAELGLRELRRYRQGLMREEEKVSYWRRLTQARIDVLQAGVLAQGPLNMEQLVRALGGTASGGSRRALMSVHAAEPLPDVPALDEAWVTGGAPGDEAAVGAALERLQCAERQLTAYRHALHARLDDASDELILRYRADPLSAFVAFDE